MAEVELRVPYAAASSSYVLVDVVEEVEEVRDDAYNSEVPMTSSYYFYLEYNSNDTPCNYSFISFVVFLNFDFG